MKLAPDKTIGKKVIRWFERYSRNRAVCFYCGEKLILYNKQNATPNIATKDHVYPKSKGGKNGKYNIVRSCLKCNGLKGKMLLGDFRKVVTGLRDGKFFGEKAWAERGE